MAQYFNEVQELGDANNLLWKLGQNQEKFVNFWAILQTFLKLEKFGALSVLSFF